MRCFAGLNLKFDTLYIGGGTPSILTPAEIGQILAQADRCFTLLPEVEATLEVNPGTVTAAGLREYRSCGINRLNIGVQSFQNRILGFLGRIHGAAEAADSLRWARRAGYDNIGLDLIYGVPGQAKVSWRIDLEQAASFEPEHLACYMLTYEKGTPLTRRLQNGRFAPLPEEQAVALFLQTRDWLAENRYVQYEISNFTRAGADGAPLFPSRHNQKYWSLAPYLGLGPAAHSFLEPLRFWNPRSVRLYVDRLATGGPATAGRESLTRAQRIIEAIFLGLRTVEGIRMDLFETRFERNFLELCGPVIAELASEGVLTVEQNRCRLTRPGMLLLDSIAARIIAALPGEERKG